jgi:glycosyltransferase involved in cell wall biosynthesis
VLVTTEDRRRRARVAETLQGADGVVAVSRDLADHSVRLGAEPGRVSVVPEGTDLNQFCPGDRTAARRRLGLPTTGRVILFVGNVLLSKGAGVLAEACGRLAGRGAEFTCYVVGRGPDADRVKATAERYAIGGRVVLVGPKPQAELPDWYRAADVVTLPSFSEGIPNVLREAIACGVPFVATSVGGIPELVRGPAGRLVPPGDPVALAEALRATLPDPPVVTDADRSVNVSWAESAERLTARLTAVLRPPAATQPGRGVTPAPAASL